MKLILEFDLTGLTEHEQVELLSAIESYADYEAEKRGAELVDSYEDRDEWEGDSLSGM